MTTIGSIDWLKVVFSFFAIAFLVAGYGVLHRLFF